jgi:very-short-patch-repair endonuclease
MPRAQEQLWQVLRRLRLNIRREAPFGPYTVDFVQHAAKLVVEVDGYWHGVGDRPERDSARDGWIECHGYTVVRISEAEVRADVQAAALRVEAIIRSRLPAAPPPSDPAPRGHLPPSRGKEA